MRQVICGIGFASFVFTSSVFASSGSYRLVVQITVDGLPTESLEQAMPHLDSGGFRRFLEEGVCYMNAEYPNFVTFTAVGHASLFTGTTPSFHGIIGNEWLDRFTGAEIYCVEDARHAILDYPTKPHEGTSPANLESTTIGDELIRATNGKSKVFSISGKDRGAILPAGKLGKAIWYGKNAGAFVTSDYYYSETPGWLKEWRKRHPVEDYRSSVWNLSRNANAYSRMSQDNRPTEKGPCRVFPHDLGVTDPSKIADTIRWTPFVDELSVDLAKEVIQEEGLGRDHTPDMLCLSLSGMDFISHIYGPDSLEAEDHLFRLDVMIKDFLRFLDKEVGLRKTLVIVSADHGFGRSPEEAMNNGLHGQRIRVKDMELLLAKAEERLAESMGIPQGSVVGYQSPFLYLDSTKIEASGKRCEEVREALAALAADWPGVAWTATRDDLLAGTLPDSKLHKKALSALSPRRGGDVLLAVEPWTLIETDETAYPATHGSPYAYDSRVPMLFMGGRKAKKVYSEVTPLDIAPTIAATLGITPPPAYTGKALSEVLR